ncbi:MAG: hypothetical protein Q7J57_18090 [Gemmobacter sp.]|nr:hypothetical protein [Gemmobacter sp.]
MSDSLYLVVEPMTLVAEDLAGALAEVDLGARVLIAANAAVASTILQEVGTLYAAIVCADPTDFGLTPFGQLLAERAQHIVFMGEEAEAAPGNDLLLGQPFSTETVADLIGALRANTPRKMCGFDAAGPTSYVQSPDRRTG